MTIDLTKKPLDTNYVCREDLAGCEALNTSTELQQKHTHTKQNIQKTNPDKDDLIGLYST